MVEEEGEDGKKGWWAGGYKVVRRDEVKREEKVARKDAWWAEGGESGVKDGGKKRVENGEKGWWEQEGEMERRYTVQNRREGT